MRALDPGPFRKEEGQLQFNSEFNTIDPSSFFYQLPKNMTSDSRQLFPQKVT